MSTTNNTAQCSPPDAACLWRCSLLVLRSFLSFVALLRLHNDRGARLCLRLQRIRCRRPRHAAGTGPRRPRLLRILGAVIKRRTTSAVPERPPRSIQTKNQHPMVQCRFQLQLQSRLGRNSANTDYQPDLTTETDIAYPGSLNTFNSKSIGDIEIMGMYTGFFKDMSTGIMFGIKLPSGTFTAPGLRSRQSNRHGQH